MASVRRQITIPLEQDEFLKEKCLSPSRLLQKTIQELMDQEKKKQEGNN